MSQPIMGIPVATPMKRPDMAQTDPKKSDFIKNNPLAGLTADDNGKVLSVVDGKPAFVEDHTLENAEKYTDEQLEAAREDIGKVIDERCQGLENGGVAKIKTTDGQMLTIFVGTHAKYEAYVAENGTDGLFALITDDKTKDNIMDTLNQLSSSVEELGKNSLKTSALKDAMENLQESEEWVSFNFGDFCFEVGKTYCVQFKYAYNSYQYIFHVSNEGGCNLPIIYTSDGYHTEIGLNGSAGSPCRLYGYLVNEDVRTNLTDLPTNSVKAKYRIIR